MPEIAILVPCEGADPGLDVVMEAKLYVVGLANLAGGVCNLIFGALVLNGELATVKEGQMLAGLILMTGLEVISCTHRLGSIGFPAALFLNFFKVAGP